MYVDQSSKLLSCHFHDNYQLHWTENSWVEFYSLNLKESCIYIPASVHGQLLNVSNTMNQHNYKYNLLTHLKHTCLSSVPILWLCCNNSSIYSSFSCSVFLLEICCLASPSCSLSISEQSSSRWLSCSPSTVASRLSRACLSCCKICGMWEYNHWFIWIHYLSWTVLQIAQTAGTYVKNVSQEWAYEYINNKVFKIKKIHGTLVLQILVFWYMLHWESAFTVHTSTFATMFRSHKSIYRPLTFIVTESAITCKKLSFL